MKKTFLIKYTKPEFFALNSGDVTFTLYLKTIWFWGLFSTIKKINYDVPDIYIDKYIKHWDGKVNNTPGVDVTPSVPAPDDTVPITIGDVKILSKFYIDNKPSYRHTLNRIRINENRQMESCYCMKGNRNETQFILLNERAVNWIMKNIHFNKLGVINEKS